MKNLIYFGLLSIMFIMFSSEVLYSQSFPIDKGSKIISGSFSFSSAGGELYQSTKGENLTRLDLKGSFGYFLSKGFNLGGNIAYNRTAQGEFSYTEIGIGPSVSYYFGEEESKFFPFVNFSSLYNANLYSDTFTNSMTGEVTTTDETLTGYSIIFGGGICYIVTKNVGIFSEAGYRYDTITDNSTSRSGSRIYLNIGISAFIY